jgi:hypothetical protein
MPRSTARKRQKNDKNRFTFVEVLALSPPVSQRTHKFCLLQVPDKLAEQAASSAPNDDDADADEDYDGNEADEADDDDHYNYDSNSNAEQDSNNDNEDDTVGKQLQNGMKVFIVTVPSVVRNCTFCLKPGDSNNIYEVWLRNTPNKCDVKVSTYVLHTTGLVPGRNPCKLAFLRALGAIDLVWDSQKDISAFRSKFDEHQDDPELMHDL